MKTAIVLGLGEVGYPIFQMLSSAYGSEEVHGYDPAYEQSDPFEGIFRYLSEEPYRFMHVCFPQSLDFIDSIKGYIERCCPEYVIIHSTLSPGMTHFLAEKFGATRKKGLHCIEAIPPEWICFYYSPVRGNVRDGMKWSLEKYIKYIASPRELDWQRYRAKAEEVLSHLNGAGFKTKMHSGPARDLEWAKLLDLAWYAVNIGFYQELERLVVKKDLNYPLIREFIESTPIESEGKVPRLIFYGGYIGGHCMIPAMEKILAEELGYTFRMMLRAVIESNMKRKSEIAFNPASVLGKSSA